MASLSMHPPQSCTRSPLVILSWSLTRSISMGKSSCACHHRVPLCWLLTELWTFFKIFTNSSFVLVSSPQSCVECSWNFTGSMSIKSSCTYCHRVAWLMFDVKANEVLRIKVVHTCSVKALMRFYQYFKYQLHSVELLPTFKERLSILVVLNQWSDFNGTLTE